MSLFFSVKSNYNFTKTIELLKSTIDESKFAVLVEMSLSDKFRSNNLPYEGDMSVLEVCNPSYAFSILQTNEDAKYLLPCRITISGSSEVTVGMINFEDFKSIGYKLSDEELFVLKELKELISIVEK